jgi:hypothetical protein
MRSVNESVGMAPDPVRISTIVGDGSPDLISDGEPAKSASLQNVMDVALDQHGNLYIADAGSSRIRKVVTGRANRPFAPPGSFK